MNQYIAVCPDKAFQNCVWADITELHLQGNTGVTMSIAELLPIMGALALVIATAWGLNQVSRIIVKS